MNARALSTALVASFVFAAQMAPMTAAANTTQVVRADRIRYVYPDSPETSNAPFPPNEDSKAVDSALHHVMVEVHGHRIVLGRYLSTQGVRLSRVVTVKIQGDAAAIYQYR